jgi:hypothetical protein
MMQRLGISIAAVLLLPLCALAQDPPPEEPARAVMMIVATGEQEEVSRLVVRAVQSQLSDLDVTFRLTPVPELPATLKQQVALAEEVAAGVGALAVFWCDFADREQVFLYLRGSEGDRILVRRLEEAEQGGMSEALAIIVRASVGELLRGGRIGIEVAEAVAAEEALQPAPVPPPPMPEPAPAPAAEPEPRVLKIAQRVGYVFQTYSADEPAVHGLGLDLGVRVHPLIWIDAGYTLVGTIRHDGDAAALRLRRNPFHLGLGVEIELGDFEVGGSVRGVLDYATFEVRQLKYGMVAVDDKDDLLVSIVPMVSGGWRFYARLHLFVSLGVEVPLSRVHYVARTPEREEVLLDPWPAQPFVFAGLRVDLW